MIVEDGTIVTGANSYMTVAEYKAYWLERGVVGCEDDPTIEASLVVSTQYIDLNNCWKGEIVSSAQTLDWPRSDVYDEQGRLIDASTIPTLLKNSLAEYASRQLVESISPDADNSGSITFKKEKLGPMEEETHYEEGTASTIKSFPMADKWLNGLTCGGSLGNFGQVSKCL